MTAKKKETNSIAPVPTGDKSYPVVELMSYLGKIVELSKSTAINTTDALNNVMDKNTPIAEYNYACYDEYPIFFQDLLKSLATIEKSLISVNDDLSKVRFEY